MAHVGSIAFIGIFTIVNKKEMKKSFDFVSNTI